MRYPKVVVAMCLVLAACGRQADDSANGYPSPVGQTIVAMPPMDSAPGNGYPVPPLAVQVPPGYPGPEPTLAGTFIPSTQAPMPTIPERVYPTPLPVVSLPPEPAPNFAFTLGYGDCSPITHIIDTADHTFMLRPREGQIITTTVVLSDDEMRTVYQKMRAINFFGYPRQFKVPVVLTIIAPNVDYSIAATNGDLHVDVVWKDAISQPTSDEADRLRELIELIKQIVEARPEVKALPPYSQPCA